MVPVGTLVETSCESRVVEVFRSVFAPARRSSHLVRAKSELDDVPMALRADRTLNARSTLAEFSLQKGWRRPFGTGQMTCVIAEPGLAGARVRCAY
jgi:hypothetical protein